MGADVILSGGALRGVPPTSIGASPGVVLAALLVLLASCYWPPSSEPLYRDAEPLPPTSAFESQRSGFDCGIAAAVIGLRLLGERINYEEARSSVKWGKQALSLLDVQEIFAAHGVAATGVRLGRERFRSLSRPVVAWLPSRHFVVLEPAHSGRVIVHDPARGRWRVESDALWRTWHGIALVPSTRTDEFVSLSRDPPDRLEFRTSTTENP